MSIVKIFSFIAAVSLFTACGEFKMDGSSSELQSGPDLHKIVSPTSSNAEKQSLVQTYSAECSDRVLSESQRAYIDQIEASTNPEQQLALLEQLRRSLAIGSQRFGNTCLTICHVPPGNSSARHTIRIGLPAIIAHLRHQARDGMRDHLGECRRSDNPPPQDNPEDPINPDDPRDPPSEPPVPPSQPPVPPSEPPVDEGDPNQT